MRIPDPSGYKFYFGADGFDAFPDANGLIWFGDDFKKPSDKGFFEFLVFTLNPVTGEIKNVVLPERVNGGGRLNWTPAGLFVSGSYQADSTSPVEGRFFQVSEFAQYTTNFPVVTAQTIEKTIDQGARDLYNATLASVTNTASLASSAKSLAQNAYDNAKSAQNTAGTALAVANNKPSIDDVWNKINDRLYILIHAIESNDRSDALNSVWMDILFRKVNDWIYGFLKDRGIVK